MQMPAKWEYQSINIEGMYCVIMDDVLYFEHGDMKAFIKNNTLWE